MRGCIAHAPKRALPLRLAVSPAAGTFPRASIVTNSPASFSATAIAKERRVNERTRGGILLPEGRQTGTGAGENIGTYIVNQAKISAVYAGTKR